MEIMNLWKAGLSLAAVIGVLLAANDSSAQSLEPIVKTQIHISLTDPDSGQVWHVQRLRRLSWADIKDCERQKAKTGRFNVSAVEVHNTGFPGQVRSGCPGIL